MSEPIYEEDVVNLGYLNKRLEDVSADVNIPDNISRHYASKPQPPYYKGDTWIDGSIVYTCINSRDIGLYTDSDWVTESGAKAEAETKNKTYLAQPTNYNVGDMWILQSDDDHKAGKKGEILITTVGRKDYNEDDWVNMIGYGDIADINDISLNINESIKKLGLIKENGITKIIYSDVIPEEINVNDLWYVTADIEEYQKGQVYKYDEEGYSLITDETITDALTEANQTAITTDGNIQIFYKNREEINNMTIGDLCNENGNLYRYNGTKWVAAYNMSVENVIKDLDTVTKRTATIETDLGEVNIKVAETKTVTDNLTGEVETIKQEVGNIVSDHEKWVASFEKRGGNNLFSYDLDLWTSYSGIKEVYSETEIIANSISGKGYLIGSGTSIQEINVQNGTYTVSFKYKKIGPELATTIVKVNDEEFTLNETEWTEFVKTIDITTNHIKIEFASDTNESLYIVDLLATIGSEKQIWTQNPNEIRTDTVTIGKGIKVESTEKNTVHRIDADGNRTFNKNTGELVAELTENGLDAKEIISRGQAQIAGILIKQQGNQTWISSLL